MLSMVLFLMEAALVAQPMNPLMPMGQSQISSGYYYQSGIGMNGNTLPAGLSWQESSGSIPQGAITIGLEYQPNQQSSSSESFLGQVQVQGGEYVPGTIQKPQSSQQGFAIAVGKFGQHCIRTQTFRYLVAENSGVVAKLHWLRNGNPGLNPIMGNNDQSQPLYFGIKGNQQDMKSVGTVNQQSVSYPLSICNSQISNPQVQQEQNYLILGQVNSIQSSLSGNLPSGLRWQESSGSIPQGAITVGLQYQNQQQSSSSQSFIGQVQVQGEYVPGTIVKSQSSGQGYGMAVGKNGQHCVKSLTFRYLVADNSGIVAQLQWQNNGVNPIMGNNDQGHPLYFGIKQQGSQSVGTVDQQSGSYPLSICNAQSSNPQVQKEQNYLILGLNSGVRVGYESSSSSSSSSGIGFVSSPNAVPQGALTIQLQYQQNQQSASSQAFLGVAVMRNGDLIPAAVFKPHPYGQGYAVAASEDGQTCIRTNRYKYMVAQGQSVASTLQWVSKSNVRGGDFESIKGIKGQGYQVEFGKAQSGKMSYTSVGTVYVHSGLPMAICDSQEQNPRVQKMQNYLVLGQQKTGGIQQW